MRAAAGVVLAVLAGCGVTRRIEIDGKTWGTGNHEAKQYAAALEAARVPPAGSSPAEVADRERARRVEAELLAERRETDRRAIEAAKRADEEKRALEAKRAEPDCATFGQVVVNRVPRVVNFEGKVCWRREGGQLVKHGLYQRFWETGTSEIQAVYGYFEAGTPAGVWRFMGDFGAVAVGFDSDGTPQFASHLATLDVPVPPYWSVLFQGGEPVVWNLLPGTIRHRLGRIAAGKHDGIWGDAMNERLGVYRLGRLVEGQRAPSESMLVVKAAKRWVGKVAEHKAMTRGEAAAIRAQQQAAINAEASAPTVRN